MNFHTLHDISQLVVRSFNSASLITLDGKLLASTDQDSLISTTSRLVVFHIIKKYLPPTVGDFIIMNDPENGGTDFNQIFIVTRLTDHLYFVFIQTTPYIDFKIPPTPLFEKGLRNSLIWSLLIEPNAHAQQLTLLFENAIKKIKALQSLKKELALLADSKNQIYFFKVIQQIFEKKFNSQALGSVETIFKLAANEQIKMKLSIDEKLNQRTILFDFSQTSLAGEVSAASHVIESMLIYQMAAFYKIPTLICQPFLDQIRMSLPPKSIVSKAQPDGRKNLLLQKTISENLLLLFENLSAKSNKQKTHLEIPSQIKLNLAIDSDYYEISADSKKFYFHELDILIEKRKLIPIQLNYLDQKIHLKFKIGCVQKMSIETKLKLGPTSSSDPFLRYNGKDQKKSELLMLTEGDELELNWKLK